MNPYQHIVAAAFLGVCVIRIAYLLINRETLASQLSFFQSKRFWKKTDFFWYGSSFLALAVLSLGYAQQQLRNDANDTRLDIIEDVTVVRTTLSHLSRICGFADDRLLGLDEESRLLQQTACLPVGGLKQLVLDPSNSNAIDPLTYATATNDGNDVEVLTEEVIYVNLRRDRANWQDVTNAAVSAIEAFGSMPELRNQPVVLPYAENVPDGANIDTLIDHHRNLVENKIPAFSPFRYQGLYWLYLFSLLIGIKLSKTYAELRLED